METSQDLSSIVPSIYIHRKSGFRYSATPIMEKDRVTGFWVEPNGYGRKFKIFVSWDTFVELYVHLDEWTGKLERKKKREEAKARKVFVPKPFRMRDKDKCAEYVLKGMENSQKFGCQNPKIPSSMREEFDPTTRYRVKQPKKREG